MSAFQLRLKGQATPAALKKAIEPLEAYALNRPRKQPVQRRRVVVSAVDETWGMDLAVLETYADVNDGFKYILAGMDVFSKFIVAQAMKAKTAVATRQALEAILQRTGRRPQNGTLVGAAVSVDAGETQVSVDATTVDLSVGLAMLLVCSGTFLDAHATAVSKDDLTHYLALLAAVGVPRVQVEGGTSAKAKSVAQLLTTTGAGIRKRMPRGSRKPAKTTTAIVQPDGSFGDSKIDLTQLGKGVLHMTDAKGVMQLHTKVSDGLRHLLTRAATKKHASSGLFLPGDVGNYKELARLAKLKLQKSNNRAVLGSDDPASKVAWLPQDADALSKRLTVLQGIQSAGDKSGALVSEGTAIADRLLSMRELSKKEHEAVVRGLLRA